jgi:tetratricopeptide (TPR) repeat protein
MSSQEITSTFVSDLLALPSMAERSAFLERDSLFNAEGLTQLLDFASELVGNNPGQARQLAAVCAEVGETAGAPVIVPQATYLRAQTYAINGEFSQAAALIKAAREQYLSLGQRAPALRTNVGLINVLAEQGQYQEAIEVGLSTLEELGQSNQGDLVPLNTKKLSGLIHKNLGICYELIGKYDQALHSISRAEALFQEAGMEVESGALALSRGSILLNLGRAGESLAALQAASMIFATMNNQLRQAKCLNNLGNAYLLLGNYSQSLEVLKESRRLLHTLDARVDQLIAQGLMADAYLALNLYPEAIAEYQAANEGLEAMDAAYQRAWVLWGLGAAYIKQSRWELADAVLAQAAALFKEADNKQLLAGVMLEQAAMIAARGDRGEAIQLAYQAHQLVADQDWPVQRVHALLRLADLVLPDMPLAGLLLEEVQQMMVTLALPHLRYRLRQRLGHLHLLQGHDETAEKLLLTAVSEIEQLRGSLTQETIRASFLRDKVAAYEDLVQLYLARGDEISLQKALNVTEQAKSRTLVELLLGVVDVMLATVVEA